MLLMLHRKWEYIQSKSNGVAKFLPRYNGPYEIIDAFPDFSAYTPKLPNSPNVFPTYHASELKCFNDNDSSLFPSRDHPRPSPVMTTEGLEEYQIDKIIDQRRRGNGWQYLV